MNKYTFTLLWLITGSLLLAWPLYGQEGFHYVDRQGRTHQAENITADAQGNLRVELGEGVVRTVRRGDYRYALVPKPDRVAVLEDLFRRGDYGRFLDNVRTVFNQYRYLGWGGKLAYWQGEAEMSRNNPELARDAFVRADNYAIDDQQREQISMGLIKALLALQENEEAAAKLQELKTVRGDHAAAFSFLAKGQLLARQGDEDQAILEFLKTVLLFEADEEEIRELREEAREHLLALLRERGDPAYDRIKNLE